MKGPVNLLLLLVLLLHTAYAGVCLSDKKLGYVDQSQLIHNLDTETGFGILSKDTKLRLGCCGTIKFWRFHAINTGTIHMQVWRPSRQSDRYQLVDQNIFRVSSYNKTVTVAVPRSLRIPVQAGDFIGWYSPNKAVIPYGKIGSKQHHLILENITSVISSTVDWSQARKRHERSYAVEAITETNSIPKFRFIPPMIDVPENTPIGDHAFKVSVMDEDPQDANHLSISLEKTSQYFEIDDDTTHMYLFLEETISRELKSMMTQYLRNNVQVLVKKKPPIGNYTLQLRVTDRCQSRTSGTFRIAVRPPRNDTSSGLSDVEKYGWVIGVSVVVFALLTLVVTMAVLQYLGILRKLISQRITEPEK